MSAGGVSPRRQNVWEYHAAAIRAMIEAELDGRQFDLTGSEEYQAQTNRLINMVILVAPLRNNWRGWL